MKTPADSLANKRDGSLVLIYSASDAKITRGTTIVNLIGPGKFKDWINTLLRYHEKRVNAAKGEKKKSRN